MAPKTHNVTANGWFCPRMVLRGSPGVSRTYKVQGSGTSTSQCAPTEFSAERGLTHIGAWLLCLTLLGRMLAAQ